MTSPRFEHCRMSPCTSVLRLLNGRAFCARLPYTQTTLLCLSVTLYLNINLLPFFSSAVWLLCQIGAFNSVGFAGTVIFYGVDLVCKSGVSRLKMDRPQQGLRPLSSSLRSVILWHKALIQTKCEAAVVFAVRRLSRQLLSTITIHPSKVTFRL